jgi:DNA-binding transcriptional ArsR family regulator
MDRKVFESLASETRINILKALDIRQMTITELSKNLGLAKSTVHEHLAKMADAGLVEKIEDHRKWSYYKLTYKGKRILHPHEMVKIMLLLSTSFIALVGGVFEIISYGRVSAPGAREMAAPSKLAEPAPEYAGEAIEKAPSEALVEPSSTALLLGVLLLFLALGVGFVAIRRWKTFRS